MSDYERTLLEEIRDLFDRGVAIGSLNKAYDKSMVSRAIPQKKSKQNLRRKMHRYAQIYV